ncbi:elongation factor G [Thermincola ferriacetica]
MKNYQAGQLRNIGIVAHGGAGKTSLVEAMLFNTGAINRLGRVEDGTTTADYHPEEIKRQITIHATLVPVEWKDCKVNLIDTPGYADFIGDVKATLRAVDSAVFVVCAAAGVEVQTEIIWNIIDGDKKPRVVFINKMDRENASFQKTLASLQDNLNGNFVPLQIPIGEAETFQGFVDVVEQKAYQYETNGKVKEVEIPAGISGELATYREKLIESAAEMTDEALEKYLNGEELTKEEIITGLKLGIKEGKINPVLCGSANKNQGAVQLLDFVVNYMPSPEDRSTEPLSALVFKTIVDPYVGKMNFVRIYSGRLAADTPLFNSTKNQAEKVGQILFVRGKTTQLITEAWAGDIVSLVKLQNTDTNDTLCLKEKDVKLDPIVFPVPTLSVAIAPRTKGDEDKLGNAIHKCLEEDPCLRVEKNMETHETILTGMGEAHIDIVLEKMKRKFGVDVVMKDPRVPYRETIRATVKVEGKHKKQTGGHGQYGHVWLRLEPLMDKEFEFDEEIFGGAVPKQYIPAVEKGIREAMAEGVIAGYPVTGIKAVVYDGSHHPVDSSEMAFKIASAQAFKKGVLQAKPILLEPVMNVEVTVPEGYMGDIISDFNTKRGRILGMDPQGKYTVVKAQVPLAEMYRYAIDLKSMTQGRGQFTMEFAQYEEVPARLAEEIINQARAAKEAAEK